MSMNSRPDVDRIINYLTIKFNKIFSDREFVCSVIEDLQTILNNKNKCYVVVFPLLGPLYLKAVRYHAKFYNLAVFNIGSGKFNAIAVCHKSYMKQNTDKGVVEETTMPEGGIRRKRPERQLYVPPAQRRSTTNCGGVSSGPGPIPSPTIKKQQIKTNATIKKANTNNNNNNLLLNEYKQFESDTSQILRIINGIVFNKNFTKSNIFTITLLNYQPFKFFKINFFDKILLKNLVNLKYFSYYSMIDVVEPIVRRGVILRNDCVEELNEFLYKILLNFNKMVNYNSYKLECDNRCDNIVDLSLFNLGHYFNIVINGSHYFYECQEKHNATICYNNHLERLKVQINTAKNDKVLEISKTTNNNITTLERNDETKIKKTQNVHEQEKEIMRKTKENINRKTRPIMKYVDDSNDTLDIDDKDSVNNWEDLFDDDGQIQDELLSEIVEKVGNDVTVMKATEDYSPYINKSMADLEHVVELYNFPSTLETHDLVQAFKEINSECMYIKWVDDTHALLVLGSLSQAQKAMSIGNPLIKVRPMTAASAISMDVANKSDLKPAIKRPQTNLQTARRLITTHLGAKSKATKEQLAKERQDLKKAKELKKLIKQNELDAWEGKLRSTVNSNV